MGLLEPLIQGFPQVTVILWNNPATRYKPSTSDFRFCGNAFFVFRGDIWRGAIGGPPLAHGFATPLPLADAIAHGGAVEPIGGLALLHTVGY